MVTVRAYASYVACFFLELRSRRNEDIPAFRILFLLSIYLVFSGTGFPSVSGAKLRVIVSQPSVLLVGVRCAQRSIRARREVGVLYRVSTVLCLAVVCSSLCLCLLLLANCCVDRNIQLCYLCTFFDVKLFLVHTYSRLTS